MFKDAIRIEWIHVEDNGAFFFLNSWRIKLALKSFFEKTCTGNLGEKFEEDRVVEHE